MNIGAHIAVAAGLHHRGRWPAARSGPGPVEPAALLGSALPDVAGMGRFRLLGQTSHDGVRAGIELHHRTDEVFHRHPWFTCRQQELVDELTRLGFGRGPARACSHVGIELLIDGVLLARPALGAAAEAAFDAIVEVRPELAGLVDAAHRDRWLGHLDRFAGRPPLADLDDPRAVARRLHRILAGRPRLAFGAEQLPALVGALERHRPPLVAESEALVEDLLDRLF